MHHIRLNTELVKKPKRLLEYVVVHEMVHLMVSSAYRATPFDTGTVVLH